MQRGDDRFWAGLEAFLVDAFDDAELRRLAGSFDEGPFDGVTEELPRGAPPAEAASALVATLRRRGYAPREVVRAVARARPARAEELRRLAAVGTGRHVFLSYASRREDDARKLADALRRAGHPVWHRGDLAPGDPLEAAVGQALDDAYAAVVFVSPAAYVLHEAEALRERAVPILPVVVGDVDGKLPAWLSHLQWTHLAGPRDVERLIAALDDLRRPTEASPSATQRLTADVLAFLDAAGQRPEVVDPRLLRLPAPVVIGTDGQPATSFDVARLRGEGRPSQPAYLVHDGPLTLAVSAELDGLRLDGIPVITLAADTVRAALHDGNARAVFEEHTRLGTAGVNLFEARNAIATPSLFFGRADLLNQVGGALERGDAVLLTGVRKAGKSSVLHMLRQSRSRRPVAWLDLQKLDRADPHWHERAFARLLAAWDRWGRDTWGQDWPATSTARRVDAATFLDAVEARRAVHRGDPADRLLVVLDELERVLPRPDDEAEAARFVTFSGVLRGLAQSDDRALTLVAADLRPEANRRNLLPGGRTNPWFQFFVEVPLPPLPPEDVAAMVTDLSRRMGVEHVEGALSAKLHAFTGGHAYLARLVAAAAWSRRAHEARFTAADLAPGLRDLDQRGLLRSFYQENLWLPLSLEERVTLVELRRAGWFRRAWNALRGAPPPTEATASLRNLGLLDDHGITIAGFAAWIGEQELPGQPHTERPATA